jgi:hypothetical protein
MIATVIGEPTGFVDLFCRQLRAMDGASAIGPSLPGQRVDLVEMDDPLFPRRGAGAPDQHERQKPNAEPHEPPLHSRPPSWKIVVLASFPLAAPASQPRLRLLS